MNLELNCYHDFDQCSGKGWVHHLKDYSKYIGNLAQQLYASNFQGPRKTGQGQTGDSQSKAACLVPVYLRRLFRSGFLSCNVSFWRRNSVIQHMWPCLRFRFKWPSSYRNLRPSSSSRPKRAKSQCCLSSVCWTVIIMERFVSILMRFISRGEGSWQFNFWIWVPTLLLKLREGK